MKNQIWGLALVAAMIGLVAAGCSSTKKTDGSDSTTTVKDTVSTKSIPADTMKKDTVKKDTSKTPPKM